MNSISVASHYCYIAALMLMMPRKYTSSELAYTKNIGNWRDPLFNSSHVLIDPGQQKSPQWQYYTVVNVPVVSASPYPAIVSVIRPQMQWQRYYDEAVNNYTNDTSNASSANSYSESESLKHQYKNKERRKFPKLGKKGKASLILGALGLAVGGSLKTLYVLKNSFTATSTTTSTSTTSTTTPVTTTSSSTSTTTPTTTTSTSTSTTTTTTPTTTTSSSTTTTTPTTTTTSTTSTSTTTTTMMPMTCSTTTTATSGTYATIRNPGMQEPQCLSITVSTGYVIKITCTSIYIVPSTYTEFYDQSGTRLITGSPAVGVTYTTRDNTLLIKSLASSSVLDQLSCTWTTVLAFLVHLS